MKRQELAGVPFMPKSRFPEAVDPAQCALHQPAVMLKAFVWEKLEALINSDPHTLLSVLIFLEEAPERARAEDVLERLAVEFLRHTALETDAEGYVHPPYTFAPRPDAPATRLYPAELMQRRLEALTKKQRADGGWPVTWPAVSSGSELEYRGIVTLNALKTLRAYGML